MNLFFTFSCRPSCHKWRKTEQKKPLFRKMAASWNHVIKIGFHWNAVDTTKFDYNFLDAQAFGARRLHSLRGGNIVFMDTFKHDFIILQEHWLWDFECDKLQQLMPGYEASHRHRASDHYDNILPFQRPRGQGGVAVLYKKHLAPYVKVIDDGSERVLPILFTLQDFKICASSPTFCTIIPAVYGTSLVTTLIDIDKGTRTIFYVWRIPTGVFLLCRRK